MDIVIASLILIRIQMRSLGIFLESVSTVETNGTACTVLTIGTKDHVLSVGCDLRHLNYESVILTLLMDKVLREGL